MIWGSNKFMTILEMRFWVLAEGSEYQSEMATVIEGSSLTIALEESNKLMFLELLKLCRSVVCCRVSPIQKAQVGIYLFGSNILITMAYLARWQ